MYDKVSSLSEIIDKAREICENQSPVFNLQLSNSFEPSILANPFQGLFMEQAKQWQAIQKPDNLHINHGMYIHKYGNGISHLVDELLAKRDTNRAILSLINMEDILQSGDLPIPSFIVNQVGIYKNEIFHTSYFRALEVSNFLPINLTEICLILQEITSKIANLQRVNLTIHAFRAYYNPDFDVLERAELDQIDRGKLSSLIFKEEKERIAVLLQSKLRDSSVVETEGLEEIFNALSESRKTTGDTFSDSFTREIEAALGALEKLKVVRSRTSHGDEIKNHTDNFKSHLTKAIKEIE
jgi:thymidylate synthase